MKIKRQFDYVYIILLERTSVLCICNLFRIRQIRDAFDHGHTTRNKIDLQIQSCLKRFVGDGPTAPFRHRWGGTLSWPLFVGTRRLEQF